MEQYCMYLRKSRFDRDYAELSVEETLKRHKAILDKLAKDRHYYVAKIFYEVVSGESIAARPEIQKMLEEVSASIWTGVLVVDLERLARGNGADQAYISQVFQFTATKIITPMKSYDPSNEFDEEYFEFGLFMSRREYKTINRRLIRGRESSASEGKYISSIAPYGYAKKKLENEKGFILEPHPEEAPIVQKVFELYCKNQGTKAIANYLNDNGVPTRHGGLWTYCTITNMVTNPVYMGKIRRGWCKQVKSIENGEIKKRIKHQKEMEDYTVYQGLHQALITEETFMTAQDVRHNRVQVPRVKENLDIKNPFAGLIYCKKCGSRIGRNVGAKKDGSRERFRCVNGRNCHTSSADVSVVESAVLEALREWLKGYKVKIDTTGFADEIRTAEIMIERKQLEVEKLTKQLETAYDLVEREVYSLGEFQERRTKLEASIKKCNTRIADWQRLIERYTSSDISKVNLVPQTEELLASYDKMSTKERNALLKEILFKIEYSKEGIGPVEIDLYPKLPTI